MDVIVVGSCNTDFISYAPLLPKEGETLTGTRFEFGCGGKGANQCVAAAKLGAKTAMISKIGDDFFGSQFLNAFKKDNINHDHVGVVKDGATGVAAIMVAEETGANSIIIVKAANDHLSIKDIEAAEKMIQTSKVLVCQNEVPLDVTLAALKLAHKHKVKSIFNLAPAQADLSQEFYCLPDIFCVNETEAETVTKSEVSSVESAIAAINLLFESRKCQSVIITLGSKGCVYQSSKNDSPVHVPTIEVNAVDSTGAGDSFVGNLAFYLSTRPDLAMPEILKRANHIASLSVTNRGTQSSFKVAAELPSDLFC